MSAAALVAACLIASCSTGAPVRVLREGQVIATASLGGPILPGKSPIGITPYLTAGAAYGSSDNVTLHGNLHLLMAAFGVIGFDAGASVRAMHQDDIIPEITVGARAIVFTDLVSFQNLRVYPDAQITASWEIADRTLLYAGTHATWNTPPRVFVFSEYGEHVDRLLISPMAGIQLPLSDNLSLQGELIWQAANVNTSAGIMEGVSSIRGYGSFGMFLGGVLWL